MKHYCTILPEMSLKVARLVIWSDNSVTLPTSTACKLMKRQCPKASFTLQTSVLKFRFPAPTPFCFLVRIVCKYIWYRTHTWACHALTRIIQWPSRLHERRSGRNKRKEWRTSVISLFISILFSGLSEIVPKDTDPDWTLETAFPWQRFDDAG